MFIMTAFEAYKLFVVYQFYIDEISSDNVPTIGELNFTTQINVR